MEKHVKLAELPNLWSELAKGCFAWDGALLDIYILDADFEKWNRVIEFIELSGFDSTYQIDSECVSRFSGGISEIKEIQKYASISLLATRDGICFSTCFFDSEAIEFNISPDELNEKNFKTLCWFMEELSRVTRQQCLLADENWLSFKDRPVILVVDADKDNAIVSRAKDDS